MATYRFKRGQSQARHYLLNTSQTVQRLKAAAGLIALAVSPGVAGFSGDRSLDPEDRSGNWSIGFVYNWQDSVYAGEDYRTDLMPRFVYTGEKLYFDTTQLGWHLVDDSEWQLDIFADYFIGGYNDHTFFSDTGEVRDEDDPLKGMERKGALEAGAALTRKTDFGRWTLDLRHDIDGVHNGGSARLGWSKTWRDRNWQYEPWIDATWHSSERADYYFGVRPEEATETREAYSVSDTGIARAGFVVRHTFQRQHNFALNLSYSVLDSDVKDSPVVSENGSALATLAYHYEFDDLAGNGRSDYNFFRSNPNTWSMRVAYGCTSDTKLNEILRGRINCDGDGTHLGSLFLSRKLSETFFTLPVEAWLTSGVARRFENDLQDDFWEGVLAFKAIFRRFPWSDTVETRFGVAEGLSYAHRIPSIEQEKGDQKGRRTSHLLNYLDFSLDVSVGDVFGVDSLRNCFAGFSVHHRSGIFASANLYGNVYGGSNVNTLYLEWEFD